MTVHRLPHDQVQRDQYVRVIGYARVNGAPADQARLLALQWERMRRFIRERAGWTIVGEFSDVTTRRPAGRLPGLRQAVAEAAAAGCDVLLVDSLDRVSRLIHELSTVIEELNRAEVTLRSAAEPFKGAGTNGHLALMVALAEHERMCSRLEHAARSRKRTGR
jgi:DNA invertase Pin-like site-specific DNA recombinase